MRILHLCLACFYIDGYNYQENVLPRINAKDGHEVLIIASTETFVDNMHLGYVKASEYTNEDGIPVVRLPFRNLGIQLLTTKIRIYPDLYSKIEAFHPDIIMAHDLTFWSVRDVVKYKKANPAVTFYADTHTAIYNSGRNWLSLNVLHRLLYKSLIKKTIPYLKKYFYIGQKEKEFSLTNYHIPEGIMEFFPLGGIIPDADEYQKIRRQYRSGLDITEQDKLFLHTGKLDVLKKTKDLLIAFHNVQNSTFKLAIIGSISKDIKEEIEELIRLDNRVVFLGWKNQEDLFGYLCASDLYCQPGSVSATLQNAICCFNPIMSFPHTGYANLDVGNFIWVKDTNEMIDAFKRLSSGEIDLKELQQCSEQCAREILDYRKLAARLYE